MIPRGYCSPCHQTRRPARGVQAQGRAERRGVACTALAASSLEAAPRRAGRVGGRSPGAGSGAEWIWSRGADGRGEGLARAGWKHLHLRKWLPLSRPTPSSACGPRSPFSHLFTPRSFFPSFSALPPPMLSSPLLWNSASIGDCPPWALSPLPSQFSLPFNVPSRLFLSRAPLQPPLHFCVSESPASLLPLRPSAPCSSRLRRAAPAAAEALGRSLPAPGLFGGIGVGVPPGR